MFLTRNILSSHMILTNKIISIHIFLTNKLLHAQIQQWGANNYLVHGHMNIQRDIVWDYYSTTKGRYYSI